MRTAVLVASFLCFFAVDQLQSQCPVQQGCVVNQGCTVAQPVHYSNACSPAPCACGSPVSQVVSAPSCGCNAQSQIAHLHYAPAPCCGSQPTTSLSYSVVQPASCASTSYAPVTVYSPSAVGHQGIVYATPLPTQNLAASNCNCGSVPQFAQQSPVPMNPQTSSQAVPQSVANPAVQQSPFSLSGYVRPAQNTPSVPCLMQFLRCCKYGGTNCAYDYYLCSQATGEPMQHRCCPGDEPAPPDEKTPPAQDK